MPFRAMVTRMVELPGHDQRFGHGKLGIAIERLAKGAIDGIELSLSLDQAELLGESVEFGMSVDPETVDSFMSYAQDTRHRLTEEELAAIRYIVFAWTERLAKLPALIKAKKADVTVEKDGNFISIEVGWPEDEHPCRTP